MIYATSNAGELADYILGYRLIICRLSAGDTNTVTDDGIAEGMVCADLRLKDDDARSGSLAVQCAEGSLKVTGTILRDVVANILLVDGTLTDYTENSNTTTEAASSAVFER